ncbi:hypothetical protein MAC_01780 [Metarhizium acridum CQMa 102]|uniref:Uncharacterized protein n=1 Tax=Metarhizium acridum (strain CQMa 102) TaxID=655827 RepID=E9DVY2_METAQ|nr:uncharacterized protein MAC_01780 [Metarhizium acridum CQMa 102]EFY92179.1 hypothetical protein MAC_01780 [Metarhizium acridum CQMa 102]
MKVLASTTNIFWQPCIRMDSKILLKHNTDQVCISGKSRAATAPTKNCHAVKFTAEDNLPRGSPKDLLGPFSKAAFATSSERDDGHRRDKYSRRAYSKNCRYWLSSLGRLPVPRTTAATLVRLVGPSMCESPGVE